MARLGGSGWFAAPNAVFDDPSLTHVERVVLLYLYRMAGNNGCSWPSYNRIAEAVGISRRCAIKAVNGLAEKGWLRVSHRRGEDEGWRSNVYELTIPVRPAGGNPGEQDDLPGEQDSPGGGEHDSPGSEPGAPRQIPRDKDLEYVLPTAPNGAVGVALSGDPPAAKLNGVVHRVPAEAIKEAWNEICGSIGLPIVKVLSEKRKQGLRMRCAQLAKHFGSDVYTVDWWRNVFQRVADSPFCRGEGGRGWVATFDWLVTRPEAIIRLLEGQYDRVRKRNTDFEREREMRHGVSDWSGEKSGVVDLRAILRQRERG